MKNSTLIILPFLWCLFLCESLTAQNVSSKQEKRIVENIPTPELSYKFIQNQRQWHESVLFKATIPNGSLFMKQTSIIYSFLDPLATAHHHNNIGKNEKTNNAKDTHDDATHKENKHKEDEKIKGHGVEVEFVGANPQTSISPEGESTENYNYFIGNDPSKWASNLKAYSNLTYTNLYHGVDMRFYTEHSNNNKTLKYEFRVAPETNPNQIQLKYKGATKLSLDTEGNLQVGTSVLDFIEQKPYCYQIIKGEKHEVKSKFVLKDSTISFELGEYNLDYELVIDPELIFASYSGSNSNNFGMTATFDNEGNLYSGGMVFGQNVPPTIGAFDVTFNGLVDILLLKFNTVGTNLLYATFLGGKHYDNPNSIIVNKENNLLIMSSTHSSDYPTTLGSYDQTYNGNYDIGVSMLNATGSQLIASTFVGGSGSDGYNLVLSPTQGDNLRGEVDLDVNNNVYIASVTNSVNFPTVNAGIGASHQGMADGVIFRLSANLSALQWSTYIGSNSDDVAYSVAITTTNDIIVAGTTQSINFQTTSMAAMPSYRGNTDGFIRRYDFSGNLLSSTFVGSPNSSIDHLYMMDIDTDNNIYVFGNSAMGNHPISPNTYHTINGGHFMYKFNTTLRNVLWSTKIGSTNANNTLTPTAFMVSDCGTIYLSGCGIDKFGNIDFTDNSVAGFPTTSDALVPTTLGNHFYLAMYEKDCKSLKYATFFGSTLGENHTDGGTSRFSKNGTVYQAMCIGNNGLPTTQNAWKRNKGFGEYNNAVFKMNVNALAPNFTPIDVATSEVVAQPIICLPITIKLRNDSNLGVTGTYLWNLGIFGTSTLAEPIITLTSLGSYDFTLKVIDRENCENEIIKTIKTQEFAPLISPNITICQGESTQIFGYGGTSYTWTPTTGLSNPNIYNPIATPTITTTYKLKINYANRCSKDTAITVTVLPKANIDFRANNVCNQVVNFTNLSPNNNGTYFWDFGNGQTSNLQTPLPVTYITGNYIVKLTMSSPTTCTTTISKTISVVSGFFVGASNTVTCKGRTVFLSARGGDSYQWSSNTGVPNPNSFEISVTPLQTTTYTVKITKGTCVKDTSITITVKPRVATNFTVTLENSPCNIYPLVKIVNNTPNSDQYRYTWTISGLAEQTTRDIAPFRFNSAGTKLIRLEISDDLFFGCDSTLTKEVIIPIANANTITPSVNRPISICKGGTAFLNATGGTNYLWTPATGLDNPNIANPRATPTETTVYTVKISNITSGCFKDTSVTVSVANAVMPTFSVTQTVDCDAMPLITLTNNSVHQAGATYLWSFDNGETSTLQNPPPFRYAFNASYNIRLTTNSSTSCSQTVVNTINVRRNANGVSATITANKTVCAGVNTQLEAFGGVSYLWSPSTGLNNATIANPIANINETTTYTVRITNAANCFVDRKVTLTVLPNVIPDFDLVVPQGCGKSTTITIVNKTQHQNGTTYLWSFGNGETSSLQNPSAINYQYEDFYNIKLTTNKGTICEKTLTKRLTITKSGDGNFLLTTISNFVNICENESTQLLATGGTTYLWSPSRGLSNVNIPNPIANPNISTNYSVVIISGNCRTIAYTNVNVQPKPVINFDVMVSEICKPLPLVTIKNNSGLMTGTTYLWDFGNGQTSNLANPAPFRYAAVGTYNISLTIFYGVCSTNFSQIVKIEDGRLVNTTISPNQTLCLGNATQLLATGGTKYLWTPATGLSNQNIANPIAKPTVTTLYKLRISNEQDCFKDTSVLITVTNELKPDFELQISSECGKSSTVKFINKSTGTGEYKWVVNGEELSGQNPKDYDKFEKSGEYEIILEMFNGLCRKTQSQKVKIENVNPANVITPNGDGKNDKFVLDILKEGWKLEIYDRYGNVKFKTDNYKNDWGEDVENQLYYYLLTSPNGKTCKGWIQVLK